MEQWYFKKSLGTVSVILVGLLVGWIPMVQATEPCIFLATQVSADGGNEFLDADTAGDAATVLTRVGAVYRLLVNNCSASPLDSVVISDTELGISEDIGFLDANEQISITSENIGFEGLDQLDRCAGEPSGTTLLNVVSVQATSGDAVDSAKDPAFVICEDPSNSSLYRSTAAATDPAIEAIVTAAIEHTILLTLVSLNYEQIAAANHQLDNLNELLPQSSNPNVFCDDLKYLKGGTQDGEFQANLDTLINEYCN